MQNATTRNPAFNQPLILISTSDAATFATIRRSFIDAGKPRSPGYLTNATH
jgi:hypothetical protein